MGSASTKALGRDSRAAAKPLQQVKHFVWRGKGRDSVVNSGKRAGVTAMKTVRDADGEKLWGRASSPQKVLNYVRGISRVPQVIRELHERTMKEVPGGRMTLTEDQLPLMAMLTYVSRAKCIVDIGTFTGINCICLAEQATGDDGRVVTIDIRDQHLNLAREYWKRAGVAHKIEARVGDGLDILKQMKGEGYAGRVDLAFVDANKLAYDRYYEELLFLMRDEGLILIDNALWYGRVSDEDSKDKITLAMRAFNEKLYKDDRIRFVMLINGDGLGVCQVVPRKH